MDACTHLGLDAEGLDKFWGPAKKVKFGGGFYCGLVEVVFLICVEFIVLRTTIIRYLLLTSYIVRYTKKKVPGKTPIYVFNGFFMQMRSAFVKPV